MKQYLLPTTFAQAYGQSPYGTCTYSDQSQCGTSTGAGSTGTNSGSGGLANTGIAVAALVTLACLIIFVSLVVRIWRRKAVPVPVTEQSEEENYIDARSNNDRL